MFSLPALTLELHYQRSNPPNQRRYLRLRAAQEAHNLQLHGFFAHGF